MAVSSKGPTPPPPPPPPPDPVQIRKAEEAKQALLAAGRKGRASTIVAGALSEAAQAQQPKNKLGQ